MRLFSASKAADTIITTPMPALTGPFVEKGGGKVSPSIIADIKVPIDAVNESASRGGFVSYYCNGSQVTALLRRACNDDWTVSLRQFDGLLPTLEGDEKKTAKIVRARIAKHATRLAQSPAAQQALEQLNFRDRKICEALATTEGKLKQCYNDIEVLRSLHTALGADQQSLAIAAISSTFPDNAAITGAVAALNEKSSAVTASVSGRIATLTALDQQAPLRARDIDAVSFDERRVLIGRAETLLKGGWLFKERPFPNAADVLPDTLFTQLKHVGEVHVMHAQVTNASTRKTLTTAEGLKEFLLSEGGK